MHTAFLHRSTSPLRPLYMVHGPGPDLWPFRIEGQPSNVLLCSKCFSIGRSIHLTDKSVDLISGKEVQNCTSGLIGCSVRTAPELDQRREGRRKNDAKLTFHAITHGWHHACKRGRGSHEYKLIRPLRKSQPTESGGCTAVCPDLASRSDGILALTQWLVSLLCRNGVQTLSRTAETESDPSA